MMRFIQSKRWTAVTAGILALSLGLAACQPAETDETDDTAAATTTVSSGTDNGTEDPSAEETTEDNGEVHERYNDETPFVANYPVDFTLISPLGDVSAGTKMVLRNLHEGLYLYNTDGSLTDGVAEAIEVTHEAPHIVAEITLREDVFFHNGDPLTAEDVKYSIERLSGLVEGITADDVTGAGYWPNLMNPQADEDSDETPEPGSIEVHDEFSLTLRMADDYGILTTMHAMADAWLVPAGYSEDEQKTHPVGLGPYEFVEYQTGNMVRMTRFEDYYGEKPEVKNVEFHKYADEATLPIAFQSQELDVLALTRETYDTYAAQDLYIHEGLSNDVRAMYFNLREGSIFADNHDLRLAFQHGINKDSMNETLTGGRGTVLNTHMTPFLETYYNDDLDDIYPYDPDKARDYLESAGYPDGLEVTLKVVAENTLELDMAVLIQEDLAEAGITVTIDSVPWATYYEEVYRGFDYELAILNVVGYPDPSRVLSRYMSDASGNLPGFQSEELDDLLNEARQSDDQEGLAVDNYKEVQRMLAEESVAVYLIDPGVQTVLSGDYEGYQNYPFAFTDISNVEYR